MAIPQRSDARASALNISMLAAAGCDLNVRDVGGYTPLMAATLMGNLVVTRRLLRLGCKASGLTYNKLPKRDAKFPMEELWASNLSDLMLNSGPEDEIRALELALEAAAEGKRRHSCCREGCENTESKAGKFKICSGCNVARYCSPECSVAAWREGHKYTCTKT